MCNLSTALMASRGKTWLYNFCSIMQSHNLHFIVNLNIALGTVQIFNSKKFLRWFLYFLSCLLALVVKTWMHLNSWKKWKISKTPISLSQGIRKVKRFSTFDKFYLIFSRQLNITAATGASLLFAPLALLLVTGIVRKVKFIRIMNILFSAPFLYLAFLRNGGGGFGSSYGYTSASQSSARLG